MQFSLALHLLQLVTSFFFSKIFSYSPVQCLMLNFGVKFAYRQPGKNWECSFFLSQSFFILSQSFWAYLTLKPNMPIPVHCWRLYYISPLLSVRQLGSVTIFDAVLSCHIWAGDEGLEIHFLSAR